MPKRTTVIPTLTALAAIGMATILRSDQVPAQSELTNLPVFTDAVDAYIYGYPLMMIGLTERVSTTTPKAELNAGRAPLNQFTKSTVLPNGSYKDVVLPSTTTLYASAFLNLTAEPVILHLPVIDRFYLMEMLDAWTNVSNQSPGTRRGSQEGDYALVGPDWKGDLPTEIPSGNVIRMPTNTMWIIGRIFTSGTQPDLDHVVNDIIPYLTLTPLSAFGKDIKPPENLPVDPSIDTVTTPLHQVANMDACAFFGTMAAMMTANPPLLPQDEPTVERLAKLKLIPGKPFDCSDFDGKTKAALQLAVQVARNALQNSQASLQPTATNWLMPLNVGEYGRQYLLRAVVAEKALGANLPEDAVYGYATNDGSGSALKGANSYTIHFDAPTAQHRAGELPPVNKKAFWSVTIYKAYGTLVDKPGVDYNAIGVGPLGPTIQDHSACFNSDGSLDLYLQADRPTNSAHVCNWLPIPPDGGATASAPDFIVFLRMYWPDAAVLRGSWIPPVVEQTNKQ
jgi:hypothetical protein